MFSKIVELEKAFDILISKCRLEESPAEEMFAAAILWTEAVWAKAEEMGPISLTDEQIKDGLRLAQSPVFVCGVHRSGTTLMRDLLDGHPELVVFPSEGSYYVSLEHKLLVLPKGKWAKYMGIEWLRRLANPINQPPFWVLGRSTDTSSHYVDFARYLMTWWSIVNKENSLWPHITIILAYASCTNRLTAKAWVDKTPTNERFLNRIWQEMPNAKIVHMIRDPFTTLSSHKKMDKFFNLRYSLRNLKYSFRVAARQSASKDSRYLLLCYEDLCENPSFATKELASFLDIENSDILTQPMVAGVPSPANSIFAKEAPTGQILKATQHPQYETLNMAEQQTLAAYMGSLAGKFGYKLVPVKPFQKFYFRLKHRLL
ncbi:MAG TPA: sulfotransferase [Flavipsychrobacter sp.]|nr:sulfotransferase [Flavipsychrobacter sp.]